KRPLEAQRFFEIVLSLLELPLLRVVLFLRQRVELLHLFLRSRIFLLTGEVLLLLFLGGGLCRFETLVGYRHPDETITRLSERLILIEDDIAGRVAALYDLPFFKYVGGRGTVEIGLIQIQRNPHHVLALHGLNSAHVLRKRLHVLGIRRLLGFQLLACSILRLIERLVFVLQLIAKFVLKLFELERAFLGLGFEKSRRFGALRNIGNATNCGI